MADNAESQGQLHYYSVWDRSTRWFHWINVICILGLVSVGLVILNDKALGVSNEGKFILKTIHVYIGYVFVMNLVWRIIWGFVGGKYARWKAVLPFGKTYWRSVNAYISGLKAGHPPQYLGHNPLGKLMVALLLLLLLAQAATGLVLAGTDLYLPPFGHEIAEWVTGAGEEHAKIVNLKPGSKDNVDSNAYAEMRKFRKPFITVHVYTFYLLLISIVLHIAAVILTDVREKQGLISAMFSGKKVISGTPADLD